MSSKSINAEHFKDEHKIHLHPVLYGFSVGDETGGGKRAVHQLNPLLY